MELGAKSGEGLPLVRELAFKEGSGSRESRHLLHIPAFLVSANLNKGLKAHEEGTFAQVVQALHRAVAIS
jgi:hypothetical protein